MNLVTQAEFAKICGITRQAVYDACKKKGNLRKRKGQIDLDDPVTQGYIEKSEARMANFRSYSKNKEAERSYFSEPIPIPEPPEPPEPQEKTAETTPLPPKMTELVRDDDEFEDVRANRLEDVPLEKMSKRSVDLMKAIGQTLQIQVKTEHMRGNLVERSTVHQVLAELNSIDTSELHPLGEVLAPDVAAVLGVDDPKKIIKVQELIDKKIFRRLEHCKRKMNAFLKKIGAERVR